MIFNKSKGIFFITLIVLLICPILSGCSMLDQLFFGKLYGPYHHDALIITPSKVVRVQDKDYCILYDAVYRLQEGVFEEVSSRYDNDSSHLGSAQDIQTDGEKLYVSGNITKNGIAVFSSDYEYEGTIFGGHVVSFLLRDDYIYAVRYVYNEEQNQKECALYKYDRNLEQMEIISKGLPQNEIIEVDGRQIYANLQGMLYWADGTEKVNYAGNHHFLHSTSGYYKDLQTLGFYYQNDVGTVMTDNNRISVTYNNKIVFCEQEGKTVLYPNIFVANGRLYFSTYEYIENENCTNDFCICHVGKSKVFEYDFAAEELIEINETNIGEYVISFDSENLTYYSNGYIIKNGQTVKSVNVVEPFGEFYQRGAYPEISKVNTRISYSVFYDHGESIIYSYFDNSKFIKDEYF